MGIAWTGGWNHESAMCDPLMSELLCFHESMDEECCAPDGSAESPIYSCRSCCYADPSHEKGLAHSVHNNNSSPYGRAFT